MPTKKRKTKILVASIDDESETSMDGPATQTTAATKRPTKHVKRSQPQIKQREKVQTARQHPTKTPSQQSRTVVEHQPKKTKKLQKPTPQSQQMEQQQPQPQPQPQPQQHQIQQKLKPNQTRNHKPRTGETVSQADTRNICSTEGRFDSKYRQSCSCITTRIYLLCLNLV